VHEEEEDAEEEDGTNALPLSTGPARPAQATRGGADLNAKIREAQAKAVRRNKGSGKGSGSGYGQQKGTGRGYRGGTSQTVPPPWSVGGVHGYETSGALLPEHLLGTWADSLGNAVNVFSTCAYEPKLMAALSQPPRRDINLKISQMPNGTWMCGNATLDRTWSTETQLHWLTGDGRISVWVRPQAASRASAARH